YVGLVELNLLHKTSETTRPELRSNKNRESTYEQQPAQETPARLLLSRRPSSPRRHAPEPPALHLYTHSTQCFDHAQSPPPQLRPIASSQNPSGSRPSAGCSCPRPSQSPQD